MTDLGRREPGGRRFELHGRPPVDSDRILGCLVGGAVGDALGAPIEFHDLTGIRREHGPDGVTDYVAGQWPSGTFTDDTQMTLFTAEGLIRADNQLRTEGTSDPLRAIWHAYQRWLDTQGLPVPWDRTAPSERSGWLVEDPVLRARRAPGNTCLGALRSPTPGTLDRPCNNSKGCGGAMRVAPIGLVAADPFELGAAAAAITHGHPSGYLAAGCFAWLISRVARGDQLLAAAARAVEIVSPRPHSAETTRALQMAIQLATGGEEATPEALETLGGGWIAEEALGIAVYCALVARDFRHGVLLAVNHGGDSDSTGSMTGNLLGAALGAGALPSRWRANLHGIEVVEAVARDLARHFSDTAASPPDPDRYPPW